MDVVKELEARLAPAEKAMNLAHWKANTTGTDEDYADLTRAKKALDAILADKGTFAALTALKEAPPTDATDTDRRTITVAWLRCLDRQSDPETLARIADLSSDVERIFNTFRSPAGSENDIRRTLSASRDSAKCEAAWRGFHGVGPLVKDQLKELVKLRNGVARKLGYSDYYALQLATQELDTATVERIFDDLDRLTRGPFADLKREIDSALAARFSLKSTDELRPWHYGDIFFQEAPAALTASEEGIGLDGIFSSVDIPAAAAEFYERCGLGIAARGVIGRSDLYERPGKCPHAFCEDMDRKGDVRTLQNVAADERSMGTMLHELGHGVYECGYADGLPWMLRAEAAIFVTEAVAMFFGRLSKSGAWLSAFAGVDRSVAEAVGTTARRALRSEQLIFSRWVQVMVRFEREMYRNPDQDLGELWWRLKAEYQLLNKPDGVLGPDYAAKIHVLTNPVYYHCYALGEMVASQFGAALEGLGVTSDCVAKGDDRVGKFFSEKVFALGSALPWNELVMHSTGSHLSPDAFARQFL